MTPSRPVSTILRWWPVLLWTTIILAMSSVPGSRLDDVGFQIPDKLIHAGEYAVLGFLAMRLAVSARGINRRGILLALLIGLTIGLVDENYQRLIPQRDSSAMDWVADAVGTVIGVVVAVGVFGRAWRDQRRI